MALAHATTQSLGQAKQARCVRAHVIASPVAVYNRAPVVTWTEVEALQEALRDAERERDTIEGKLMRHEEMTKQLTGKVRQLAMAQATMKLAVKDLKGMLGDAKQSAALEHRHLFGEKLHVCGKSFRDEDSVLAYLCRQEQGMARLSLYDSSLTSITGSLKALLSENVATL